jgi:hypothetical protein
LSDDHWFIEATDPDQIEQGDLLFDFPVVSYELGPDQIQSITNGVHVDIGGTVRPANVAVLSQSCDLLHGKIQTVITCPFWSVEEFSAGVLNDESPKMRKRRLEDIRQSKEPPDHMLFECVPLKLPRLVVDFRKVIPTSKQTILAFLKTRPNRPRLVSPYREALSYAFGRHFQRVAYPIDIPQYK